MAYTYARTTVHVTSYSTGDITRVEAKRVFEIELKTPLVAQVGDALIIGDLELGPVKHVNQRYEPGVGRAAFQTVTLHFEMYTTRKGYELLVDRLNRAGFTEDTWAAEGEMR